MNKLLNAMTGALLLAACAAASAAVPMTKEAHQAAKAAIEAAGRAARAACTAQTNNPRDICMAEARGKEQVAMAELDANHKTGQTARLDMRLAKAQADHDVAMEKCDDLAKRLKGVCIKLANDTLASVQAEVKASQQATRARNDPAAEKRNADYAVAREKCEALPDDSREDCINAAKLKYVQL